ncbi:thiamine phosphate synthase [Echinicola strongylocentroti]|uniref:Thiamine-phosphate synthase n=1 Tax=Echinicola strongylocentroti TaxID=1795355 RepID=A0A2Z4IGG3_9BACT|nr:thiamine phosphate synthase [Echinicola strongylocentroti]AWW30005.1 thiamine phosphate synthase [Echinicola strongylocentroti]
MTEPPFPYRLYLVTDQQACLGRDFFWVLEEALKGGVDLVQLREKELPAGAFLDKALKVKSLCDRYEVPLIINDSLEIAKETAAHGVHIGQSDSSMNAAKAFLGEQFPVGLSLEQMDELDDGDAEKAWYYGVSPIFSTPTKPDTRFEWGLGGLSKLRKSTAKPLVAIGNINVFNAVDVLRAGADCLAVVSAICSADSPAKAAESFRTQIEKVK